MYSLRSIPFLLNICSKQYCEREVWFSDQIPSLLVLSSSTGISTVFHLFFHTVLTSTRCCLLDRSCFHCTPSSDACIPVLYRYCNSLSHCTPSSDACIPVLYRYCNSLSSAHTVITLPYCNILY